MVAVQHSGHVRVGHALELAPMDRHGDDVLARDISLVAKVTLAVWVGPTGGPDVEGETMEMD
jgi:hypothetical protein